MLCRHHVNLNSSGQAREDRPGMGGQGHFRKQRWGLCLGECCPLRYLSLAEIWGSAVNTVKSVSSRKLKSGKHPASKEAAEVGSGECRVEGRAGVHGLKG